MSTKESFINLHGIQYNNKKKDENERINNGIVDNKVIEAFNNGNVHSLNDYEQQELTNDENLLAKKQYDLATKHKTFMERNQDLLLETRECVKRCQNSTEKQKLTKKEWRVQKRSCLAGCGVGTGELDEMDKHDGFYKNDNGEHRIPKCETLRKHAEAPPPTKVIGEQCYSSKECFSFKCGNSGDCKGKCAVSGKYASSWTELVEGTGGEEKTYCGDNINRLIPDKGYNFYFRTGTTWNLVEGFKTSLKPIKFCKNLSQEDAIEIMNVYGIRCYGVLQRKKKFKFTLLEDPNNGLPKPTWKEFRKKLLDGGAREGRDGFTPIKNLSGGWNPSKMRQGRGEVGEGDADRNRDCKSGKVVHDPLYRGGLGKYGLSGRPRNRWMDYCISAGDKIFIDLDSALWKQLGSLLQWCTNDKCDLCFSKESPPAKTSYKYIRKGECAPNGSNEWIKFRNRSDNRGGWSQKVKNCAEACKNDSRDSKGFIVYPYGRSRGRCWCEKNDSRTCKVYGSYRRYDFVKDKSSGKEFGTLTKCSYENPKFPFTLFLGFLNPKYKKVDFARGTWHWWPKYRGRDFPDWWGRDWLEGLGVIWGKPHSWLMRYSSYMGKGKSGAERLCNRSDDCAGFFESNPNQYHFIFPGGGQYKTSGRGKNVRNIWIKDGKNFPKPEPSNDGTNSRYPKWWWTWWYTTPEGRKTCNKKLPTSGGYCGSNGSLDQYEGRVDTVAQCAYRCQDRKKLYAGVGQGQYCYCGDEYWKGGMQRDCTKRCKGGSRCGGRRGVNMYYSGYNGSGGSSLENLDGPPSGSAGPKFNINSSPHKVKDKQVCPPDQSYIEFFSNREQKKDYSHMKVLGGLGAMAGAYYLYQKA